MKISFDLHIHSALSPCSANDMTPNNIINMAYIKGLDVISITDHNTMQNIDTIIKLGKEKNILVLPGIEVTTKEEVHVLCYFKSLDDGLKFSNIIYDSLKDIINNKNLFGNQLVLDENDKVIKEEEKLLINTSSYSLEKIYTLVNKYNGILVPAHLDKMSNSMISILGFIPDNLRINTIELSKRYEQSPFKDNIATYDYNRIINSDAHNLIDISEPDYFMKVKDKSLTSVIDFLSKGRD